MRRLRTWAERALLALLSGSAGTLIAACYGPIDDGNVGRWELASGTVRSAEGGVAELEVCARFKPAETAEQALASLCATTGASGAFLLEADQAQWQAAQDQGFLLSVRDRDGEANGGSFAPEDTEVEAGTHLPVSIDVTVQAAP